MNKVAPFAMRALVLVLSLVLPGTVFADVPALTVSGNQILSGGEAKNLAGNSFFTVDRCGLIM
jgi:hypothetical protein